MSWLQWALVKHSVLAAFVLAGIISLLAPFTSAWLLVLSGLLFVEFLLAGHKRRTAMRQAAALQAKQAKDLGY